MKRIRAMIAIFFMVIAKVCNASATMKSLSGTWDWADSPESRAFSIDLKQHGSQISRQYCAVAQNGRKTDCDDEKNPNLHGALDRTGQSAVVGFTSFFGAENGKAVMRIIEGRLIWHIHAKSSCRGVLRTQRCGSRSPLVVGYATSDMTLR